MTIAAYVICGLVVLGYLVCLRRCERPVRTFIKSALGGVASLMAVNVLSGLTTVGIQINIITVGFSALFGAVGTVLMLIMRLFH